MPVIDGGRLLGRIDELARVGRTPAGGVTRLAWSPDDLAARALVSVWATGAGATVRIDPAGNLIAEVAGADPDLPPLVMGSHLDTVVDGGALDGAYGVVAAVEVAAALTRAHRRLRHPLRIVAFANEEGVVAAPFTGSRAIAGAGGEIDVDVDGPDGRTLANRLADGGGDAADLGAAAWPDRMAGYLELHIEQGPVLDEAGVAVGVVTAIAGRRRLDVVIEGRANHAGTTPMALRHDAMVAAAHAVLAVQALALDGLVDVATVGSIAARPGNANVVAGQVTLSVDLRATDDRRRDAAVDLLRDQLKGIGAATGTTVTSFPASSSSATLTDTRLTGIIRDAACSVGAAPLDLVSGAGHDAQHMAALGPIGMIFVPSIGGVSHNPAEATAPADLVRGADVLLAALMAADDG